MKKGKVVLAYSGGLDTSVSIKWLIDEGYDVVACCLDVGEGKNLDFIKEKALKIAKQKAADIKKKSEELVNLAVEKGTPVLQKAADEVRQKAIVVVKEVLKRLEKEEK